jgi:hypothetical protein
MSKRARHYVILALTVLLGVGLGLVARAGGWSDVQHYAAAAGLLAVIVFVGMPWREFAPDGAFRRRSPSR